MKGLLACVLACLVGLQPAAAWARQTSAPGAAAQSDGPPAAPSAAQPGPAVESLGMSFERIKRGLRMRPPTTSKAPLKLDYYVEVQGLLPPIPIFRPGESTTGPVPYGAPTHWDMMNRVTPEVFRAGAVPVSTLAIMGLTKLIEWEAQRAREERREKERQAAIEAERERQKRLKESLVVSPPK